MSSVSTPPPPAPVQTPSVPDGIREHLERRGLPLGTQPFTKQSQSPERLLTKLKERGLAVRSEPQALAYVRQVGGFRLKGYYLPLTGPDKRFNDGVSFDHIADRYEFDHELRLLVFAAIARLEVAVRTTIANRLSTEHGPHWFLAASVFDPHFSDEIKAIRTKIESDVVQSKAQPYVENFYSTYSGVHLPPSWAVTECLTFARWSLVYRIIADPKTRKAISSRFNIDDASVFQSWLHSLSVLRNIVAHHDRIIKKHISVNPKNYKKRNLMFDSFHGTFFPLATILRQLLPHTVSPPDWKHQLTELFARYPGVPTADLGFPGDWTRRPGW